MPDTIAAVATPPGEGAIALLRISGPQAVALADAVFAGKQRLAALEPGRVALGHLVESDGKTRVDQVLASVFRAPHSYTGEDVVEISCHGGILVTRRALDLFLQAGARSANPGEFTERAFLNGKMDLTRAEAVMDLIRAQTDLALRSASEQLEGVFGARIQAEREELLSILAHLEAYIDFPEEDIDPDTGAAFLRRIAEMTARIDTWLGTAGRGRILREGLRTVICGEPNVGKSSLLNLLLGYDRAIVNPVAGTTRDTIEEVINLRGIPVRLVDTAGLHESRDPVEREGMSRTLRWIERADLVLHVVDATTPPPDRFAAATDPARTLLVANKADLAFHPAWRQTGALRFSCVTGEGIGALENAIAETAASPGSGAGVSAVAINARHQSCLQRARTALDAAAKSLRSELAPDLAAVDLREALDAIGDVVGRADAEEILGVIFSQFCIGK